MDYLTCPNKEQKCSLKQVTHGLDGCPCHALCSKCHLVLQIQLENLNHLDLKSSVSVPIAKQFLTINEKWVLVKFMKALGTFCV